MRSSTKKLLSMVLTVSLAFGLVALTPMQVAAATQLPAPAYAKWDPDQKGKVLWAKVPESDGNYRLILYHNGKSIATSVLNNRFDDPNSKSYAPDILDEGDYYFEVQALGWSGWADSPMQKSGIYTYDAPEEQLPNPSNLRWDGTKAVWDAVDSPYVGGYEIRGIKDGVDQGWSQIITETEYEFTFNDVGVYEFTVCTVSNDIEKCRSGNIEKPSKSDKLDLTEKVKPVSEALDDILKTVETNPSKAVTALQAIGLDELAKAMRASTEVANKVKQIEDLYKKAAGITVSTNNGSSKISGSISIIGAAFNADQKKATLKISDLTAKEDAEYVVDKSQYSNWVKVNIDLEGIAGGKLTTPIQIRMPIPTGVKSTSLVILHVKDDGSVETITPAVSGDYVTFTVTSFSQFIFANTKDDSKGNGQLIYTGANRGSSSGSGRSGSSSSSSGTIASTGTKEVAATVSGNVITVKGQTALGLMRITSSGDELVRGTDYTVRSIEGGVEIRILKSGSHDLRIEFVNALARVKVTGGGGSGSQPQGGGDSQWDNVNANPGTGR